MQSCTRLLLLHSTVLLLHCSAFTGHPTIVLCPADRLDTTLLHLSLLTPPLQLSASNQRLCKFLHASDLLGLLMHLKYGYMLTTLTSNWTLHSTNWTTTHKRESGVEFTMQESVFKKEDYFI